MTTPSALSPAQSPEQSLDGSPGPDAEQESVQEPAPTEAEAAGTKPAETTETTEAADGTSGSEETDPSGDGARTENELRTLLGLGPVYWGMPRTMRIRGWLVTGVVGVIAALLRLIGLGHPKTLMFDEIGRAHV